MVDCEQKKGLFPDAEFFHYRTTKGAEVDFVMEVKNKVFAIECKDSYSPVLSKGDYLAFEDVKSVHTFIITASPDSYGMKEGLMWCRWEILKE